MRCLEAKIVGKVMVRRSVMGEVAGALVWATELKIGSWLGKREAVWPSWPMPRIVRSKWRGSCSSYLVRHSGMESLVSK